jgi:hypothetical protein
MSTPEPADDEHNEGPPGLRLAIKRHWKQLLVLPIPALLFGIGAGWLAINGAGPLVVVPFGLVSGLVLYFWHRRVAP